MRVSSSHVNNIEFLKRYRQTRYQKRRRGGKEGRKWGWEFPPDTAECSSPFPVCMAHPIILFLHSR